MLVSDPSIPPHVSPSGSVETYHQEAVGPNSFAAVDETVAKGSCCCCRTLQTRKTWTNILVRGLLLHAGTQHKDRQCR